MEIHELYISEPQCPFLRGDVYACVHTYVQYIYIYNGTAAPVPLHYLPKCSYTAGWRKICLNMLGIIRCT